jgi:hypothetical protein
MEAGRRLLIVLVGASVLAMSCASPPAKPAPAAPPAAPAPQPAPSSPKTPASSPQPGPAPATGGTASSPTTFVATEELYRATFAEVQQVIAEISKIIAAGDYSGWLSYLTADYVASRSSPAFLAAASNSGVLKKNGIVLKTLRDYFDNVVVRSRLQATLDDIQFVDETHVKAIALVQGTPVILYYLVHEGGKWKVGIKAAGDS